GPVGAGSTDRLTAYGSEEAAGLSADILPTSYEVGVLNGRVQPGDVVVIVGAGPIGLAAILTARLYTPSQIIAIDTAESRREAARRFGADVALSPDDDPVARFRWLCAGIGSDVGIDAVGILSTY